MRRWEIEYVQEFFDIFMKLYNAIPTQFKLPISSVQLQYDEAFDSELTLWLSERRLTSLASMMKDTIEVEINLTTTINKKRDEGERRRDEGERIRDGGEWRREEG